MSHFPTSARARAAMLTALIVPALSACANQSGYIADDDYYYADLKNPVPEASGQKTAASKPGSTPMLPILIPGSWVHRA